MDNLKQNRECPNVSDELMERHITISSHSENSQDCFCYKQFHSLNNQAVCDFRGLFMNNECRWPGIVHDSNVFANSSISMKMRYAALPHPQTFQNLVPGLEKIPNYLIGDPAYCIKECDHCSNTELVVLIIC